MAFGEEIEVIGGVSGESPGGPAGGDLTGTYPNPTIGKLQGNPVSAAAPGVGALLGWNGSDWVPIPSDTYVQAGPAASGDTSGATDKSNIEALAPGYYLMQSKPYYVTTLTIPEGVILDFGGWTWLRDNLGAFGNSGWGVSTNYTGGILHVLATSGSGVTMATAETSRRSLRHVLIVGPGTGTSVGLAIGSSSEAVTEALFVDIGVGNFATGVQMQFVEDGVLDLKILGCGTPLMLATYCNNLRFTSLEIQKCSSPMTSDTTCTGLVFIAPLFQSNTGQSAVIEGNQHWFIDPWLENPSGSAPALELSHADYCGVIGGTYSDANDTIQIDSTCIGTVILTPLTSLQGLTDNGVGTIYPGQGAPFAIHETRPIPYQTAQFHGTVGSWSPAWGLNNGGYIDDVGGGSLNDYFILAMPLPPGTYRVDFAAYSDTDSGEVAVTIDSEASTDSAQDLYAASGAIEQFYQRGIAVTGLGSLGNLSTNPSPYLRAVKFQVTGKNSSSSGYQARLMAGATITRTA